MPGGEVRLVGLEKRFGEVTAVDGIELVVAAGAFFSLLGRSGCGQTTTLRLIAALAQPTAGRILLDGSDMAQVPPHRRKANTELQRSAPFPLLNVRGHV